MREAFVDAADVRFPTRCARCGAPAEATHTIQGRRGFDLIIVEYSEYVDVAVSVCRACNRLRRANGIGIFVGTIVLILGGGFVAMTLAVNEQTIAAAVLATAIGIIALVVRFKDDELIEWAVFGLRVRWLKGAGRRLQLAFRREGYFGEWVGLNPTATFASENPVRAPARDEEFHDPSPAFTRTIPAIAFLLMAVSLAVHHGYAVAEKSIVFAAVILLPAFGALALGGVLYPPIFWAIGKYGRHLPLWVKVVGVTLFVSGFAAGFYLAFVIYAF